MNLFGHIEPILAKALNGVSARQKATANNLANVNTPGFKRGTVPFEKVLKDSITNSETGSLNLRATHSKHIKLQSQRIDQFPTVIDQSTGMRNDGNNVDLEQEVAQLTKDTLLYYTLIEMVNSKFDNLRTVVTEGRR